MKKRLCFALVPILAIFATVVAYQSIFSLPQSVQLSSISEHGTELSLQCYRNAQASPLDKQGKLDILVWNIYKQNREAWQQELERYSSSRQLVLLQEASMTDELHLWVREAGWFGSQVDAFKAFDISAGVLNLTPDSPSLACAYLELEPWLQLPKSGLYATYPLSNGQTLAVVNIHAVNFTYGTVEYQRQLSTLVSELEQHAGPVIVGGDFNSWSEERLAVMKQSLASIQMKEVAYESDNRTEFVTGLPLDHLFYRGLRLIKAEAPTTDASDHNPILASFELQKP